MTGAIKYETPTNWILYDKEAIFEEFSSAVAAVMALKAMPFQRRWVEELQKIQLKMEVDGTSKIEGADFAGNELDTAIRAETPEALLTRSHKQANCAVRTYKWISQLPNDMPINEDLICEVHRSIVTGCDEDHCDPGKIRRTDQNVTFGLPQHRGVDGGPECSRAFKRLAQEIQTTFTEHHPLIATLAVHYHFAAMHPFLDGNGRAARALEALMLQRAGLKDSLFIAMSNYYYDEKRTYLDRLAAVRAHGHDLTPFLKFALKGIALQSDRLAQMIRTEVSKHIFRSLMQDLFTRLQSTRKRVIVKRQLMLLDKLLDSDNKVEFVYLTETMKHHYATRKSPRAAIVRDINRLSALGAITVTRDNADPLKPVFMISVNLDWPTKFTDTEVFAMLEKLPKSKTYGFLSAS